MQVRARCAFPPSRRGSAARSSEAQPMRGLFSISALAIVALNLSACHGELRRALPADADREARRDATACDKGDLIACHNAALAIVMHPDASDEARDLAIGTLQLACENSVELSCRWLADDARTQTGDPMAGEHLLRTSCGRGDTDACVLLAGRMLDAGHVSEGYDALFELCHAEVSRACIELGRHHLEGTHTAPNPALAANLLSVPCAQGSPVACRMRAIAMIAEANSADAITTDIIALLGNACLGADELACRILSGLYHDGVGVEQDQAYAKALLRRGCTLTLATEDCDVMIPPPTFDAPNSDTTPSDAAHDEPARDGAETDPGHAAP